MRIRLLRAKTNFDKNLRLTTQTGTKYDKKTFLK